MACLVAPIPSRPEYVSLGKFPCMIYSMTGDVGGDVMKDSEVEFRLVMVRQ